MSTTETTESFDPSLKDELFAFEDATEGDIVRGEVTDVEKWSKRRGEKIRVRVRLPTGSTFDDVMDYPKGNTQDYRFVRLVESLGYSIGSAEHMIGDEVQCHYTDQDDWGIVVKRSVGGKAKQAGDWVIASGLAPLWIAYGQYQTIRNDEFVDDPVMYAVVSGLAILCWFVGVVGGVFIVSAVSEMLKLLL